MPDLETSISYCTYCPKLCRHTCPVSHVEARETLVPQTKMATLGQIRARRPADAEQLKEATATLYACTGCGRCTSACLHGIEVGPALFTGRQEAERDGRGHPALADLPTRFDEKSRAAQERVRALVPGERRPLEAQVAFLAGCERPEIAPRMLDLCDRIGADYVGVVDGEHGCGGYPLYAAGKRDAFLAHAEQMKRQLAGYARVVVHCPQCAWLMRHEYPEVGVTGLPAIENSTEFLGGFIERIPISDETRAKNGAAHYHDPCYLGRRQGVYEAPRQLGARALTAVLELSRNRSDAECSGGGGLLPETMPAAADAIARERLLEVKEVGANKIITACPTCQKRLTRDGVQAVDLVELLEESTRPSFVHPPPGPPSGRQENAKP